MIHLKKTATILSNLAQNFNMFIGSTLQLAETVTDPINLNINDLAVSRTVKEVLDTLCLFKQIYKENYKNWKPLALKYLQEYKSGTLDAKTFEKWLKYTSDEKIKSKLKTTDEFKD